MDVQAYIHEGSPAPFHHKRVVPQAHEFELTSSLDRGSH